MLVFMVRGIFIPINFAYAQYATRGITLDKLFAIVWEVVECAGFKVLSLTADK